MCTENNEVYVNIYDKKNDNIESKLLEEMVKELVACTMPLNFHIEALKCQSIIIRTRLVRQMKAYGGVGTEECKEADILKQDFEGLIPLIEYKNVWKNKYEEYKEKLEKAALETTGKILLFNNKPIDPRTHLVCGGSTENSENIEGNAVRYLRRVLCNYCEDSPYSLNYKDISIDELEKKLGLELTNDNFMKDITINKFIDNVVRDEQDRVTKIKIGNKEFSGKEIMEILDINSTRFSWRPQIIRFFTVGKGDGLGLCQYGANNMANNQTLAEEILKYYYTGVIIKKIQNPCINKPLEGKIIMIDPAHGGENSDDNVGNHGLREKDVNLSIALYLVKELESIGANVYLTRDKDEVIHLNDRAQMAKDIGPDFFISIHQNYFSHCSKSGTEIYYFRGDKMAKELAEEIMPVLTNEMNTLNKGIKSAEFFLLREIPVSSIHIEVAYISNFDEERILMSKDFRKKAAKAIAKGFINFYKYI